MRVQYAIVFVSDMKRAVEFYRDVVGLPLAFESPEWTEFATEGATLALHVSDGPDQADGESSAESATSNPPGRCRPGLHVADLAAFHARMTTAGVPCTQKPRELHGTVIAQYVDPDGLPFSVSEPRR